MRTTRYALIALTAIAGAAHTVNAAEQREAEQLCNYCQDYTDAAMAAGSVRTAYKVGTGYSDKTKIADARQTSQPSDDRK